MSGAGAAGAGRLWPSALRRRSGEQGATLIEFAIVLPVMLVIAFGLIELGFAAKSSSTVTGASRTGARLASSTYADAVETGSSTEINTAMENLRLSVERDLGGLPDRATPVTMWVYEANAAGDPTGGATCTSSCMRYTWNAGTGHFNSSYSGSWTDPVSCGTAVDYVGVRITAIHEIDSPFLNNVTVVRDTTMRVEPVVGASC